jgi:hypothetical protein
MSEADTRKLTDLLQCALQLMGRIAIPPETVRSVVAKTKKHVAAYNLCDGTRTLSEVARRAGLDQGNFSKAAARWVESGVIFWMGEGREKRLLHVYPISAAKRKK